MDVSGDLVQQISADVTHAVVGDGRDKGVLRALGAAEFDCGIVAIGDSLGDSIPVFTALLKRFCVFFSPLLRRERRKRLA